MINLNKILGICVMQQFMGFNYAFMIVIAKLFQQTLIVMS